MGECYGVYMPPCQKRAGEIDGPQILKMIVRDTFELEDGDDVSEQMGRKRQELVNECSDCTLSLALDSPERDPNLNNLVVPHLQCRAGVFLKAGLNPETVIGSQTLQQKIIEFRRSRGFTINGYIRVAGNEWEDLVAPRGRVTIDPVQTES